MAIYIVFDEKEGKTEKKIKVMHLACIALYTKAAQLYT